MNEVYVVTIREERFGSKDNNGKSKEIFEICSSMEKAVTDISKWITDKLLEGKKKFESNPKLYPLVVYSKELHRLAAAYDDGRVIFWYWTVEKKPLDTPLD